MLLDTNGPEPFWYRCQRCGVYFSDPKHENIHDEQIAYEAWLENKAPSGDCESVERQWGRSYDRRQWEEESQSAAKHGVAMPEGKR